MASTYSPNLKIELIGTGDQSGTWGNTTNTNLGTLIEEAIAGFTTQAVTDGAATVLTIPNGASSTGRHYVIELTGALTANRTVEVPAVDKPYIFFNNTTGGFSVTVKVSGQTGVTIANGKKAIVYTNSTDVIEVANAPVTEAGTQTLTNKTLTSPAINGPTVVAVNSASDALRITQTGAGNALVVEDSTNPDATPFVVNTGGQLLIGRTTAPFGSTTIALEQSAADTAPTNIDFSKSRAGVIVNSGDGLGRIRFWGYDGASLINAAEIISHVDGTPGTNDMPGRLVFNTTADGASSTTERMRITCAGNVGIGTSSPAVRLAVSSTDAVLVPVGTTAQRPTPATGYFRFNTTTGGFEGYNGTAWGAVGGGATGGAGNAVFYENDTNVTADYTITAGKNAMSAGPITINSGITVTVPSGSVWTIV